MNNIVKIAIIPTDFLIKIVGGSPILAVLFYFLVLLLVIGAPILFIFKRKLIKMKKGLLLILLAIWLASLVFIWANTVFIILTLAVWSCALSGGGSGCYL